MFRTCALTALTALFLLTAQARTASTIRIWKVGSPHTGATPDTEIPQALAREAGSRGWRLSIEAFPALGFASRFFLAVRDGSAPDLLVIDNFGIMNGIATGLGTFVGVGEDPSIRKRLIQVTGSFDELLGPARGWTFLFTSSTNYAAARQLALRPSRCGTVSSSRSMPPDLAVAEVATAYLGGDPAAILPHADSERLTGFRANHERVIVGGVAVCGGWGNERLAFLTVDAFYQAETTIGHASLLLAFRKISSQWQLLVAARDPVSNGQFAAGLPALSQMLAGNIPAGPMPSPATLRSPQNGQLPIPPNGARFGDFEWQSSPSEDVVAEIAEFSYDDDARLFLLPTERSGRRRHVSAGQLWTTGREWAWRVWSISRSGEIALSEVRTFVH
jgi:hypothetical protein